MTALYRCRGATSEIAGLFSAVVGDAPRWTEVIWPGEPGLVIPAEGASRSQEVLRWGLDRSLITKPPRTRAGRATIFSRDLNPRSSRLGSPQSLRRCLIIVEAVAYPIGLRGHQTRAWAGLIDIPLFAWAGVISDASDPGFAGLLVEAHPPLSEVSSTMPLVMHPPDHQAWLDGVWPLALPEPFPQNQWYLECLGERWATGAIVS